MREAYKAQIKRIVRELVYLPADRNAQHLPGEGGAKSRRCIYREIAVAQG